MTFWLEKYRTDRTWYGNLRLEQGGRWTMLYPAARPLLFSVLASAAVAGAAWLGSPGWLFLLIATVPLFIYGLLHYRVRCLELLTNHKRAGGLTLTARPRVGRILGITLLGNLIIGVLLGGFIGIMAGVAATVVGVTAGPEAFDPATGIVDGPVWVGVGLLFAAYLSVFLLWQVLRQVFITLPEWEHYAETLTINGVQGLPSVRQRGRDDHVEAEGFAEALDLGASI
jgi:hypothetical protein